MADIPERPDARPRRRATGSPAPRQARRPASAPQMLDDRFFRHIVSSMRNGVLAFRRDGTVALMNDEAYRIFGLSPSAAAMGGPFADVLSGCPESIRVLGGAFDLSHLPNRAELRLKDLDRVIGYTL